MKTLGAILVLTPFVLLFALACYTLGFLGALSAFGAAALLVGCIVAGVELMD
jgi:hypothetical protein